MRKTFILMTGLLFLGTVTSIGSTEDAFALDPCVDSAFDAMNKMLNFTTEQIGSFTIENNKDIVVNGCVDPRSCWNFADNTSQQNLTYKTPGNSYADDFEIWNWLFEYCMDGLYAPAILVGC